MKRKKKRKKTDGGRRKKGRQEEQKGGKREGGREKERETEKKAGQMFPKPSDNCACFGLKEQKLAAWSCLSEIPQETSLPSASLCQCRSDQKRKHECFTRMLIHHFGAHPWQIPRVDCVPVMSARSPLVSNGQEPFTQYFCRGCCSKKEKCTAL